MASNLRLIIYTPQEVLYSGDVVSVSMNNEFGLFDILPDHTQFVSIVSQEIKFTDTSLQQKALTITSGIVRVEGNVIELFCGFDAKST